MKRVLKWDVPVDADSTEIGVGAVVLVACQDDINVIQAWVESTEGMDDARCTVKVFGTGHEIPTAAMLLGSCIAGPYVWHLYSMEVGA